MSDGTNPRAFDALAEERIADHFHDECGVFGIYNHEEASHIAYLGLYALQHRGQESAGICTSDEQSHYVHRAMGLVADVFEKSTLDKLYGQHAVGHVRYSTAGESLLRNAQPFCAATDDGPVSIAHNGNLVNVASLRHELQKQGTIFSSSADSEVIVHLLARSRESSLEGRLIDAVSRVTGAFSLIVLTADTLIAARDPNGFRPLSLARLDDAWVVASESCAMDLIGATFVRDVEPGEVVVIRDGELTSFHPFSANKESFCIFEYIYFARPDSNLLDQQNVYAFRKELGRVLCREYPAEADMVVPVLDSGTAAALGYAEESGIPYETALIRNHYVQRTFIEPAQSIRHFGVKVKHNAVRGILEGKRVILVEDSIVRGTTLIKIVTMLRNAGAQEVHVRVSSPPTMGPCHYGIDTPDSEELIAHRNTPEEICKIIGADSLGYLSIEGLRNAARELKHNFCDACFSLEYPVQSEDGNGIPQLSLFRPVVEADVRAEDRS